MEIKLINPGEFKIVGKKATITLNQNKVMIGEIELSGAGEYEIKGIPTKGFSESRYLFVFEDISILYIGDSSQSIDEKELSDYPDVKVLLTSVSESSEKNILQVVKTIEPSLLIFAGQDKEISSSVGALEEPGSNYKLTTQQFEIGAGQKVIKLS